MKTLQEVGRYRLGIIKNMLAGILTIAQAEELQRTSDREIMRLIKKRRLKMIFTGEHRQEAKETAARKREERMSHANMCAYCGAPVDLPPGPQPVPPIICGDCRKKWAARMQQVG